MPHLITVACRLSRNCSSHTARVLLSVSVHTAYLTLLSITYSGDYIMAHQKYAECIKACYECAAACDHCATACLSEPDPANMADCIRTDLDCAQMCRFAAAVMARGSDFAEEVCRLCAKMCKKCGDECAQHDHDHCKACAEACLACAEECRKMAA